MRLMPVICALSCTLLAAGGCGGGAAGGSGPEGSHARGADPLAAHAASYVAAVIDGSNYWSAAPGGITVEDTALRLHSSGIFMSFAIYRRQLEPGAQFVGLGLEVADIEDEFWVGLSDYGGSDSWQFFGPFDKDNPPPSPLVGGVVPLEGYADENGFVYWAAVVAEPHSVLIERSIFIQALPALLERPPRGDYVVDPVPASDPDLLLLPEISDLSVAGAPLIAYTSYDGGEPHLVLAYYNSGEWQRKVMLPERHLIQPRLLRDTNDVRVLAFDPDEYKVVDLPLSVWLDPKMVIELPGYATAPVTDIVADCRRAGALPEPADEILAGVVYSSDIASVFQLLRWTSQDGWDTVGPPTEFLERITGAALAINQQSGNALALVSHGEYGAADNQLTIDTALWQTVRVDGLWSEAGSDVVIDETNQAPLGLSLGYDADGAPQLVAVAARDFSINEPIRYSSSLLFDVVVGARDGGGWDFARAFTSTLRIVPITPPLPPEEVELTLKLAPFSTWSRPNQLIHSQLTGTVVFEIRSGAPQGGSLASATEYLIDSGAGYEPSAYYSGRNGTAFSFGDPNVGGGCAYIAAPELDYTDVLRGQFPARNDLRYWSPD